VKEDGYPLMGEFEFRHYPSPRQYKRGEMFRDVEIPINGKVGQRLFAFSQESGIPFQIHYEIEDKLLPPLEEVLAAYPGAKVIWCHLAQIRYQASSSIYGPDYVEKLIKKYPNIYFDTSFGSPVSVYPGSGERHARIWEDYGRVKKEWIQVIIAYPWRFLSALDIGGDRMDELPEKSQTLRIFLENLPEGVREIVAYKAAWKLLFNEDF
ncbi:MAG: amidohydrolase family protein, partial [Nitrospirae bacterium]|nr:amidohydrolase family protein [Nitrospirota bacterium]